jgi:hypothetical protein
MNKAITDGLQLMPPAFEEGLGVWSSGDGTAGSDTYQGAANAALVPSDQDFGGCLELQKTASTQRLRYMGQTPIFPGCYLQIKVRVKAISGNLPSVRVAAWASQGGGSHLNGVVETGPQTTLTNYGEVVEVTAIVGTGSRGGVDMPWGIAAQYGHFGLDLTGSNGGIVRIDDIQIIDITGAFLRDMIGVVDVRDYGAVGNGVADDSAAFEAADNAAAGRRILVPAGTYRLASGASMNSEIDFEGTVTMPDTAMLLLTKNYDLPSYIAAFGNEELAFKKAFQALLNNADHESLDMKGRMVTVTSPIDMAAAVPNRTSYSTRRIVRNGQFTCAPGSVWDTETFTSQASYNPNDSRTLSNVSNVANIPVGALVEGNGVGREVYVRSKNVGAGEITLNVPLHDASGTQTYTFRSFKFMLDFSGFSKFDKFGMQGIEFQCSGHCSAIRLAPSGTAFSLADCFISRPKDRGVNSFGTGCQGMLIDQCQFLSAEDALAVSSRSSIGVNASANDVKLRHCRATRFRHFAVLGGDNSMVLGNHFFQGDSVTDGVRSAGLVVIGNFTSTTIAENYIDNCSIEWTNEHDPTPDENGGFSFSAMSITDNIFLSGDVAPWFSYIVIKPYGTGHFLNGVTVTGNKFRSILGSIDRAERVDTSIADLDYSRFKEVIYEGNTYHNVSAKAKSPLYLEYSRSSPASSWVVSTGGLLPFQGNTRAIESVTVTSEINDSSDNAYYGMPWCELNYGANDDQIALRWERPVKGSVSLMVRVGK